MALFAAFPPDPDEDPPPFDPFPPEELQEGDG